jgi:hypothetical protein
MVSLLQFSSAPYIPILAYILAALQPLVILDAPLTKNESVAVPDIKQFASKPLVLLAGSAFVLVGVLVILTLAWLLAPISYWLFGTGAVALGLLLRKVAVTAPKNLKVSHAALSALGGALLFMDAIVLIRFIADWAFMGANGRFNFAALIWAMALTLAQIVISKIEDRIAIPAAKPAKENAGHQTR